MDLLNNLVFKLGSRAEFFALKKNTSRPSSPIEGQLDYDDTSNVVLVYDGSSWAAAGAPAVDADNLEYSSGTLQFSAAAAGAGLSGGAGSALAVGAGTGVTVNANDVAVDTSTIATRSYVDGVAQGITAKAPVRVATTANITISTALNNGDTLDGVTLATNDRVLVKDQSTPSENGIYIVAASPSRATDWDASGEVRGGTVVWVQEGTTNADTGWVITTDDNDIVPGTDAAAFVQFSGLGQITAGAGLTKTGNTINVGAGTDMTVNADDITPGTNIPRKASANTFTAAQTIDLAGAGSTLTLDVHTTGNQDWLTLTEGGSSRGHLFESSDNVALQASNNLILSGTHIQVPDSTSADDALNTRSADGRYALKSYAADVGDGSSTTITVTHNLGTRDVQVAVREASSPYAYGDPTVKAATTNTVTLEFATAPSSGQYRCIVSM